MKRIGIVFGTALACGGADPFDAPSAYESQPYLCPEPAAFAERLAACRAAWTSDQSCAGLVSMQGVLEGVPLTVTSEFSETTFTDEPVEASGTVRDRIEGVGVSPYFQFTFRLLSIGGASDDGGGEREFSFASGAESRPDHLSDEVVAGSLRASNGSQSSNFIFRSGELTVTAQSANEEVGVFHGEFEEPGDVLDGCVHYLATEHLVGED